MKCGMHRHSTMYKTDHTGFDYQGKHYDYKYCIMQIIAILFNPKLSILIVSTNNEKLLKMNQFTRKAAIPYYVK